MHVLSFVFAWANLPFSIAGGIAVVFAALSSLGIPGDHDGQIDIADSLWSVFGVGRIPLSIAALSFGLAFAITGLLVNVPWLPAPVPLVSLLWSVPIATAAGAGLVALVTKALRPLLATAPFEATKRTDLVGLTGIVISSSVTREFGEVRVKDRSGHELRLVCKLAEGHDSAREGDAVVFMEVDESGALTVAPESTLSS